MLSNRCTHRYPRMTGGFKVLLLLLSLCLVVWTKPIDRNQDPPEEEKPEENAVKLVSDLAPRLEHAMCINHFAQYSRALLFWLCVHISGYWSVL